MADKDKNKKDNHKSKENNMLVEFRRRFWVSLVLTVPIIILSEMLQSLVGLEDKISFAGDRYLQFVLATAVYVYGGWPFIKGMYKELSKKNPGMMTLIALAISIAYFYSSAVVFGLPGKIFFWELATLIDVMLLGHWIEMKSVNSASNALEDLIQMMPDQAHRLDKNGKTEDVSITDLQIDDKVLVKPGEKVPVDGEIIEGTTSINEAMLTGESKPVEKTTEDEVVGGSINGESSFTMLVKKTGDEMYLSQVVEMVENAQQSKSRSQDIANRAAFWLTIIAITAGAVTLISWLAFGKEFVFSLERMVTVMVITCPHALGLAVPLVVAVTTGISASKGLLIQNRTAFEGARKVDTIIFDKTGTLTEGRFGVTDVFALGDKNEDEIIQIAASLESQSEHPIAQGITDAANEKGLDLTTPEDFKAISGKGAQADINGKSVKVVSKGYLKENDLTLENEDIHKVAEQGKTVVYVLIDESVEGAIALADIIRKESRQALDKLKSMGIKVMMMTGDTHAVAKWVAEELQLDDFFAEVLPDKKAEKVKEVQQQGNIVAMTGDGINDAPALVQADVGIAIGAGTDVAIDSADVVLVNSNPNDVASVLALSKASYRKTVQNLFWATGYNVIAIPLAAGVLYKYGIILNPAVGAAVMALSTIIVAINARFIKI